MCAAAISAARIEVFITGRTIRAWAGQAPSAMFIIPQGVTTALAQPAQDFFRAG